MHTNLLHLFNSCDSMRAVRRFLREWLHSGYPSALHISVSDCSLAFGHQSDFDSSAYRRLLNKIQCLRAHVSPEISLCFQIIPAHLKSRAID